MSERFRNDLYYVERLRGAVALYPDGTAGQIEEIDTDGVKTVRGRRPDRPRIVKYKKKLLTQTALYDTVAEYRIADKDRLREQVSLDIGSDDSWTIEDMPDRVIAKFREWESTLPTITSQDVLVASMPMAASTMEELETATINCPWCKNHDHRYACRGCNYSRAYYKYPLIRLQDNGENYDVPFDVAGFLQTNPQALTYETRPTFTREGKMSAVQYAVLCIDKVNGAYIGRDSKEVFYVDKGDDLHGTIELPLATWKEAGHPQTRDVATVNGKHLPTVIAALQEKCILKVREQTDTKEYQELYEQFIGKLKSLGKSAMTPVIEERNWGMGDFGYELRFGRLPFERGGYNTVVSASTVRWLIEKALPMIDEEKGVIDFRWEGGY